MNSSYDPQRRFGGVAKIYSESGLEQFKRAHVCIIGLGGVGSWVAEALARSAIGHITLIDMDHSSESNINRQLQATDLTLGQAKIESLKQRILQINPACKITLIDDFISAENQQQYLSTSFTWVVDCIDSFRDKAALIYYCRRNKIKIITVGGAGGMIDPSQIKISDLSKTIHDPLLAKVRKLLRQNYHFPTNPSRRFAVPCIYSEEQLKYPDNDGGITTQKPQQSSGGLNCSGGFGSSVVVTASMGFFAASHVLQKISAMPLTNQDS